MSKCNTQLLLVIPFFSYAVGIFSSIPKETTVTINNAEALMTMGAMGALAAMGGTAVLIGMEASKIRKDRMKKKMIPDIFSPESFFQPGDTSFEGHIPVAYQYFQTGYKLIPFNGVGYNSYPFPGGDTGFKGMTSGGASGLVPYNGKMFGSGLPQDGKMPVPPGGHMFTPPEGKMLVHMSASPDGKMFVPPDGKIFMPPDVTPDGTIVASQNGIMVAPQGGSFRNELPFKGYPQQGNSLFSIIPSNRKVLISGLNPDRNFFRRSPSSGSNLLSRSLPDPGRNSRKDDRRNSLEKSPVRRSDSHPTFSDDGTKSQTTMGNSAETRFRSTHQTDSLASLMESLVEEAASSDTDSCGLSLVCQLAKADEQILPIHIRVLRHLMSSSAVEAKFFFGFGNWNSDAKDLRFAALRRYQEAYSAGMDSDTHCTTLYPRCPSTAEHLLREFVKIKPFR